MPMVVRPRPRTSTPRFRAPPWHDGHPARCDLEQRLAPDHLATAATLAASPVQAFGLPR